MVMLSKARLLVMGIVLASAGIAQAAPTIFAYNATNNSLISFDALTPGNLTSNVPLTGLAAGESLIGIDYRPATGTLYSVAISATTSRVVTVNPTSGVVTAVGAGFTPLLATAPFYGIDFNPVPDRIRVVNSSGLSIRLNPNDGALAGTDTSLAYVAGDPGVGTPTQVSQVAYTNNFAGTTVTTLFGIDFARDVLVRIGGVDGTPSPNTGALTTVGSLGVVTATPAGGFDIETATGTAFAVLRVGTASNLYRVNLASGAATLVGAVGGAANVNGITIIPTPVAPTVPVPALGNISLIMLIAGFLGLGVMLAGRRQA